MGQTLLDANAVKAYWWDGEPNFGDLMTPYFLRRACDKNVINVRGVRSSVGDALVGVGSILHDLRYPGAVVWGSGFGKLAVKQFKLPPPIEVLALRGELSLSIARDAGWPNADTLGDPGLLASRLMPRQKIKRKYIIVPHHSHHDVFLRALPEEVCNITSAKQSPAAVLGAISESEVVVSSSLHGVIVAHSYAKPWVWVNIKEHPLYGGEFKFRDFFSGMSLTDVAEVSISEYEIRSMLVSVIRDAFFPLGRSVTECQESLINVLKGSQFSERNELLIHL
ncbi:polysaccharide pyruvyl transferase family protein [Spectribacter hydrogenooxidans]|uniref:Polysaccharide pyruvyl transferase family protein n=1 Tax=Spectribacter hydrogenoxidans TaxID=3075608 RepID=A0ABU3C0B4_9GAMM|nr:polysaccharide pyruvyl transferase family protein [Salinisphaera sp. W335]MDT0635011.1 polysaccharide pyruvyl transferase family protein [Salinisphaera sp. W335]